MSKYQGQKKKNTKPPVIQQIRCFPLWWRAVCLDTVFSFFFSCQGFFPSTVSRKEKLICLDFGAWGWLWVSHGVPKGFISGMACVKWKRAFHFKGKKQRFKGSVREMVSLRANVVFKWRTWEFRKSNIRLRSVQITFFLFPLGCCWSFSALSLKSFTFGVGVNNGILTSKAVRNHPVLYPYIVH